MESKYVNTTCTGGAGVCAYARECYEMVVFCVPQLLCVKMRWWFIDCRLRESLGFSEMPFLPSAMMRSNAEFSLHKNSSACC